MILYGNLQMCQQCNLCNKDTLGPTKIILLIKVTSFSTSESIIWDHNQVCTLCRCPYLQVSWLTGFTVCVHTIIKLIAEQVCTSMQNTFTSTDSSNIKNSHLLAHALLRLIISFCKPLTLMVLSLLALIMLWASGTNTARFTNELWPLNSFKVLPDFSPWILQTGYHMEQ